MRKKISGYKNSSEILHVLLCNRMDESKVLEKGTNSEDVTVFKLLIVTTAVISLTYL